MKRILFLSSILCTVLITSAFTDFKVVPAVLHSFENTFGNAKDVKWSIVKKLYLAEFTIDEQKISAYYDVQGNPVATARFISTSQLPVSLQAGLKKHTHAYYVSQLFELNNDAGTTYYVTLLNQQNNGVMLKSVFNNEWMIHKKIKN